MARRVFFSFHYENDIWRACIVRNAPMIGDTEKVPFHDASLWEEAKKKGDAAIQRMIDKALEYTSVTAVLIGAETASRKWVAYEIEQSIKRGNGLLGVRIHMLKDRIGNSSLPGAVPTGLTAAKAPVYDWDRDQFGAWVEAAAKRAGR